MREENIGELGINEKDSGETLDPLRSRIETHELSVVMEAGHNIVDHTNSQLDKKSPPISSKCASDLRWNLKPPSPQPWDLVDPPDMDDSKGKPDYYTTLGSSNFKTLQSTKQSRSLIPKSSYYFGPPPSDAAFYTPPVGQIGFHHPREIIRIERDYSGGELIQFAPIYPIELDGRITPTHFLESINAINELLISAHSLRHSFLDNTLAILTFQLSRLLITSHYDKASTGNQEMQKLQQLVDTLNVELYNPAGLNILWPRNVAFLYVRFQPTPISSMCVQ
ncbi:Golgin subfamily A member 7 [Termitomyces sp. J132]|nr:Golgin subfamily A member 7 [Termitomyces sp. J132]